VISVVNLNPARKYVPDFAERIVMDGMLLPILIAVIVALMVVCVGITIRNVTDPDKRKLKQRLSNEDTRQSDQRQSPVSITVQDQATGLSARLAQYGPLEGLYRQIIQVWPDLSLVTFLSICAALSITLAVITYAFVGAPIVAVVGAVIGGYAPFLALGRKRSKRQRMIADQLPDSLDFLARVLKAGHSFSTGLQMMADELPQPLGGEFRRAYDQHSLGLSMEEALKDMAARIESTDFAFFVTATLIQRQTGGDLSEVLGNISGMIRQRIRLAQSVKAKTAEGRFTGYILSAFPAVMFLIASMLNPDYTKVLWTTTTGMVMLAVAFILMLSGLFCIKKITTVRV
jgi:tight adherence protein B